MVDAAKNFVLRLQKKDWCETGLGRNEVGKLKCRPTHDDWRNRPFLYSPDEILEVRRDLAFSESMDERRSAEHADSLNPGCKY